MRLLQIKQNKNKKNEPNKLSAICARYNARIVKNFVCTSATMFALYTIQNKNNTETLDRKPQKKKKKHIVTTRQKQHSLGQYALRKWIKRKYNKRNEKKKQINSDRIIKEMPVFRTFLRIKCFTRFLIARARSHAHSLALNYHWNVKLWPSFAFTILLQLINAIRQKILQNSKSFSFDEFTEMSFYSRFELLDLNERSTSTKECIWILNIEHSNSHFCDP